jgi:hypothetical protein
MSAIKYFSKDNLGGAGPRKIDLKSMTLNMLGKQAVPLPFQQNKLYDVIVIGGGTGGLSFA